MARGKVGFVDVGALINPTEAISSSLNTLSGIYGNQADRQAKEAQLKAEKAESNRRFGIEQARLTANDKESKSRYDTAQSEKLAELNAREATNKWMSGVQQGSVKYLETDYSKDQQSAFKSVRDRVSAARNATESFFTGEATDADLDAATKALRSTLDVKSMGETEVEKRINQRKTGLLALRAELDTLTDPAAKQNRLKIAMDELYQPTLDRIQEEIASGSSLVKKQKNSAIMRTAPQESLRYGNYDSISKAIQDTLSGETEKSLLDAEKSRVSILNSHRLSGYNSKVDQISAYNKANNLKGKSGKKTGYAKLIEMLNFEGTNDLGSLDNPDFKEGMEFMLGNNADGISLDADTIALALSLGKDTQLAGMDKIFPAVGSDKFDKLFKFAQKLDKKKKESGGTFQTLPEISDPLLPKTVGELQRNILSKRLTVPRGILNVAQEYRDKYKYTPAAAALTPVPNPVVDPTQQVLDTEVVNPDGSVTEAVVDTVEPVTATAVRDRRLVLPSNNRFDQAIIDGVDTVLGPTARFIGRGVKQFMGLKPFTGASSFMKPVTDRLLTRAEQLKNANGDVRLMRQQSEEARASEALQRSALMPPQVSNTPNVIDALNPSSSDSITGIEYNQGVEVLNENGIGSRERLLQTPERVENSAQQASTVRAYLDKAAIGRTEPLSVGERNNNPGNIRAGSDVWNGSNGNKDGFVNFNRPEDGITALGKVLRTYRKKGFDTIEKIMNRYAPPTDHNPTEQYIKNIAKIVGKGAGEKLDEEDMAKVMQGIFTQETVGGRNIKMVDIIKGWESSAS